MAWLCGISNSLPFLPSQIEVGLQRIRSLLSDALPYHSEPYTVPFQAHLFQQINPYKLSRLVTKHVKTYLRRKLNFEARAFLLARFSNVKWHFVASPQLLISCTLPPSNLSLQLPASLFCVGLSTRTPMSISAYGLISPTTPLAAAAVDICPLSIPRVFLVARLVRATFLLTLHGCSFYLHPSPKKICKTPFLAHISIKIKWIR